MKLDLVLKGVWFDRIESGEKSHEYREIKPYWIKRLTGRLYGGDELSMLKRGAIGIPSQSFKPYDVVVFHRGYTKQIMTFEIKHISITKDKNNDLGEICFDICLGDRL